MKKTKTEPPASPQTSRAWLPFRLVLTLAVVLLAIYFASPNSFNTLQQYITSNSLLQRPCANLSIYRYGEIKPYTGSFGQGCTISQKDLIPVANGLFPETKIKISRFLTMTGRDLPEVITVFEPLTVIGLGRPDEEHFMWPTVEIGYTAEVEVGEEKQKVRVKTLSKSPRVFEIENLLTPEECDHFYQTALAVQEQMNESLVGADAKSSTKSSHRSSRHTWIGSVYEDGTGHWLTTPIIERVERRILDLTRLPKSTAEPFQVVFYNMSDYYYGHHDYTDPESAPNNPYYAGGGNRYVTVLLYLNDVEEGGHTVFPFADPNGNPQLRDVDPKSFYTTGRSCEVDALKVHPRKGGAAMFYNLEEIGHMDGARDQWSLHAGCKPTKGPKYISNKWVRNKRVNGHLYDDYW